MAVNQGGRRGRREGRRRRRPIRDGESEAWGRQLRSIGLVAGSWQVQVQLQEALLLPRRVQVVPRGRRRRHQRPVMLVEKARDGAAAANAAAFLCFALLRVSLKDMLMTDGHGDTTPPVHHHHHRERRQGR
uniref:Uncharacterized protein n=1 Tax=Zea mays TaxID=4577 RepID=C0PKQ0_MAIZE|nr:unknown [Zea mays]